MASSREDAADPVSERRPLQFSLRAALLFTAVLALLCGLVAWRPLFGVLVSVLSLGVALAVVGRRKSSLDCSALGFILIVGALVYEISAGAVSMVWDGSRTFAVPLKIIDAESGEPIPNASVRLTDRYGSATAAARTDSQGVARVSATLRTSGRDSLFEKSGGIYVGDQRLDVTADGYEDIQRNLAEHVGKSGWDLYAPVPTVIVELEADKSGTDR